MCRLPIVQLSILVLTVLLLYFAIKSKLPVFRKTLKSSLNPSRTEHNPTKAQRNNPVAGWLWFRGRTKCDCQKTHARAGQRNTVHLPKTGICEKSVAGQDPEWRRLFRTLQHSGTRGSRSPKVCHLSVLTGRVPKRGAARSSARWREVDLRSSQGRPKRLRVLFAGHPQRIQLRHRIPGSDEQVMPLPSRRQGK